MISKSNLYNGAGAGENNELFSPLGHFGTTRIESIRSWLKEPGEWYDQEEDEWVVLLEGEAQLEIEGTTLTLTRGDHLMIPKHTLHRVISTSRDALWLAVFSS